MCEHCSDDHRDNKCEDGMCPDCCSVLCHHNDEKEEKDVRLPKAKVLKKRGSQY